MKHPQLLVSMVVAVGAIMFLQQSSAIQCFVCNSCYQLDCADWFDNVTHHLVQCKPEQTKCRKIVQEVWLADEHSQYWDVRYIRQCATEGEVGAREGRECEEIYRKQNTRVRHCYCDNQDGCNDAGTVTSQFYVVFPAFLTMFQTVSRVWR